MTIGSPNDQSPMLTIYCTRCGTFVAYEKSPGSAHPPTLTRGSSESAPRAATFGCSDPRHSSCLTSALNIMVHVLWHEGLMNLTARCAQFIKPLAVA